MSDANSCITSTTVQVKLVLPFGGFQQPVDSLPTFNTLKVGSATPVKFSLGSYAGLNIFAPGYPKIVSTACIPTAPLDAIEEVITTAGGSSLSYDPVALRYSYGAHYRTALFGARTGLDLGQ